MMDFVILTLSFTIGMLLASVISVVVMFQLMGNAKVMKWCTNYYVKMFEKSLDNLDKEESKDLGA